MGDADRIRRLAARDIELAEIASRLKLRPAVVRRVLGRPSKPGPRGTRGANTTLSFATSPETALRLRDRASERGVSLSHLIDQTVREALGEGDAAAVAKGARRAARKPSGARQSSAPARAPTPRRTSARGPREAPTTAADTPECVRKLLKSYDPEELQWAELNDRHEIVVTILTRGDAPAKRWLSSVLSRSEVRNLVKEYRGAGCSEPDRALLRHLLRLTTTELPTRAYLGFGTEPGDERADP